MNTESTTGRVDHALEDMISIINNSNDVVNSIPPNCRAPLMEAVEPTAHSSRNGPHPNSNTELLDPLPLIRAGSTPDFQHCPVDNVIMSPPPEIVISNLPLPDAQLESVMIQ
jgi:hypothetical protein